MTKSITTSKHPKKTFRTGRLTLLSPKPFSPWALAALAVVFIAIGYYVVTGGRAATSLQANCLAAPGSCGYPDPAYGNVGVPQGTTPTPSGSITVDSTYIAAHPDGLGSDGRFLVNGLNVTGTITVSANNVTIENTRVAENGGGSGFMGGDGNSDIRINAGVTGTLLQNDTLTNAADGTTVQHAVYNYGDPMTTVADGLYVYTTDDPSLTTPTTCNQGTNTSQNTPGGGVDSMWFGPGIIKNSYEIAGLYIACDHIENVYEFAGQYLEIDHSTLINPGGQTATIFVDGKGGVSNVLFNNNFLVGGGYTLYPAANGGSGTAVITNNRFARCLPATPVVPGDGGTHLCTGGSDSHGYYPYDGAFGLESSAAPNETWTGNYWDDSPGQTICDDRTAGCAGVSSPDTTPPSVSLSAPTNGATVSGTTTLTATASDNVAVSSVQFQLNGASLGSPDTTAPYTTSWNTTTSANGSYTLAAVATDSSGNTTTSAPVTVTVSNSTADTTPPTTTISSGPASSTTSTSASFAFTGQDNVTPAGSLSFQCQLDGGAYAACTSPKAYTGLAVGSHTFNVRATDAAGNTDPTPATQSWAITSTTAIAGDINGDGVVNVLDLSVLLSHYGTNYAPADLNHDNIVNIFDLSILLGNYGK